MNSVDYLASIRTDMDEQTGDSAVGGAPLGATTSGPLVSNIDCSAGRSPHLCDTKRFRHANSCHTNEHNHVARVYSNLIRNY